MNTFLLNGQAILYTDLVLFKGVGTYHMNDINDTGK